MPPITPRKSVVSRTNKTKAAFTRKKNCFFCMNQEFEPDYKDTAKLRRYISERGRIVPQSKTRTCARHQRAISTAIKQARTMALFA